LAAELLPAGISGKQKSASAAGGFASGFGGGGPGTGPAANTYRAIDSDKVIVAAGIEQAGQDSVSHRGRQRFRTAAPG
jgi:hypothetical protein